jgi:phosphoglycolate phosphatase
VSARIVVFWDIDGTLLTTARAGVLALEGALHETAGVEADLQGQLVASGLTEHQVAAEVFRIAGVDTTDELVDRFLRAYERRLPSALPLREGRVLDGVREVLEALARRDDVDCFLLTGNTPAGARAKLEHYGLSQYFSDGAFCVGPGSRVEIAREASLLAKGAERVFVVGDTPYDIECGEAIGARTIAVATGSHSAQELAAHRPWALLDRLEPDSFLRLLGS